MKITIRPPIEIDVDGDDSNYCGKKCRITEVFYHQYECIPLDIRLKRIWHIHDQRFVLKRCQACLDAEKEMNDGTD